MLPPAFPSFAAAPLVEAPAAGREAGAGGRLLYAQAVLMNGKAYEGRLRFDDEEAFWGDHFNSDKEPPAYLRDAPNRAASATRSRFSAFRSSITTSPGTASSWSASAS